MVKYTGNFNSEPNSIGFGIEFFIDAIFCDIISNKIEFTFLFFANSYSYMALLYFLVNFFIFNFVYKGIMILGSTINTNAATPV